jgi:hypothetical protein
MDYDLDIAEVFSASADHSGGQQYASRAAEQPFGGSGIYADSYARPVNAAATLIVSKKQLVQFK